MRAPSPTTPDTPGASRRPFPRSLIAFALLAGGISLSRALPDLPASLWFSLAASLCAVAALTRGRACILVLSAALLLFGAGWYPLRVLDPVPGSLRALLADLPTNPSPLISVTGILLDDPHPRPADHDPLQPPVPDDGTLSFRLLTQNLDTPDARTPFTPTSGTLRLHIAHVQSHLHLRAGDRIAATGAFESIPAPLNPGEPDRRLNAWQEGLAGDLRIPSPTLVTPDSASQSLPGSIYSLALRARATLTRRAHDLLLGEAEPGRGRAFLAALILGESEPGLSEVRGAFQRLGLAHILAISGFHIVVMVGVALFALRATGDLGRLEPLLVAAITLLYLTILPFQAPVWRSALTVLALLLAESLGRRHDRLTTLGWIACALLLWRPLDFWSLGFQLSFGLVALLLWIGQHTHDRLFTPPLKGVITPPSRFAWLTDHAKTYFSSTLLCVLASMPLLAWTTGIVSPFAVLAGAIAIPPVVALMILSYAALALGILIPPIAGVASASLGHLASWTASLVELLDAIPGSSWRAPPISLLWAAAATLLILYFFRLARRRDPRPWIAAFALLAWLAAEFSLGASLPRNTALRIDTLAVGDGTCHIVRSGADALLWDCGSLTPGVGRILVPRAARALGVWHTPTAVITHPNLDHFNGILDCVEPLGIRTVCVGEAFITSATRPRSPEAYFLSELRRRGVEIRTITAGDRLALGQCELEFLSPPKGAPWPKDNDLSLVARISLPPPLPPVGQASRLPSPHSLLLCGDIEDQAIATLRAAHPRLRADIMEVPHHGSAHQAAIDWLADINPPIALQSTGPKRANDPRWLTARTPRTWYCTCLDGASWVEIDRTGALHSGSFLNP